MASKYGWSKERRKRFEETWKRKREEGDTKLITSTQVVDDKKSKKYLRDAKQRMELQLAAQPGIPYWGKTETESMVASAAQESGYKVFRSGWPDLLLVKDSQVIFCEVKSEYDILRVDQIKLLRVLETLGLNVKIAVGDFNNLLSLSDYLAQCITPTGK